MENDEPYLNIIKEYNCIKDSKSKVCNNTEFCINMIIKEEDKLNLESN